MDDRQSQIREGAGLQESRVNQDLVDFLSKWGPYAMLLLAAGMLVPFGLQQWERRQADRRDAAYAEYRVAGEVGGGMEFISDLFGLDASGLPVNRPSVQALAGVAEDFGGVGSVAELCRLRIADEYLRSGRLGIKIGAVPGPQAALGGGIGYGPSELADEQTNRLNLQRAFEGYVQVLEATRTDGDRASIAVCAAYGAAASAASLDRFEDAEKHLETARTIAEASGFTALAEIAASRKSELGSLRDLPALRPDPVPEPLPEPVPEPVLPEPVGPMPVGPELPAGSTGDGTEGGSTEPGANAPEGSVPAGSDDGSGGAGEAPPAGNGG